MSDLNSIRNKLRYTNLTYDDIMQAITNILNSDDRYKNLRESQMASILLELLAGTVDLANYNIERQAEEMSFSTGKRMRGHVKLSNDLGYDIKRPTPSLTTIKFIVYGKDTAQAGEQIIIPQYTDFEYNGNKFFIEQQFVHTITTEEAEIIKNGDEIEISFHQPKTNAIYKPLVGEYSYEENFKIVEDNIPIRLFQGEFRVVRFTGVEHNQVAKKFQKYYIEDPTFSNFYGEYDLLNGETTLVGIGTTEPEAFSELNRYSIERKTLLKASDLNRFYFDPDSYGVELEKSRVVLIRTSSEASNGYGIEIRFGDGITMSGGVLTEDEFVFVKYLSTLGKASNEVGVIGNKIDILDTNGLISSNGYTIEAELTSNVIGGSDIESLDSISVSAPGNYQSFDRLVNNDDYRSYLESLTSPIVVRNAIAWGEQDELDNLKYLVDNGVLGFEAIRKLFNVILFTVVGELYELDSEQNLMVIKEDLSDAILDYAYSPYSILPQNYVNVLAMQKIVEQLKIQQDSYNQNVTIRNGFATPQLTNDIYVNGYSNFRQSIENPLEPNKTIPFKVELTLKGSGLEDIVITNETEDSIDLLSKNIFKPYNPTYIWTNENTSETHWGVNIKHLQDYINNLLNEYFGTDFSYLQLNHAMEEDSSWLNKIYYDPNNENLRDGIGFGFFNIKGNFTPNTVLESVYDKIEINMIPVWDEFEESQINQSVKEALGESLFKFDESFENNVSQRDNYPDLKYGEKITQVIKLLNKRQQNTVRSVYISPIIHDFKISGNVYVKDLTNRSEVEKRIKNGIYSWLNERNNFNNDVYRSNLIDIIEDFDEVLHTNIKLEPNNNIIAPSGRKYFFDWERFEDKSHYVYRGMNESEKDIFYNSVKNSIKDYLTKYGVTQPNSEQQGTEFNSSIHSKEDLLLIYSNVIENELKSTLYSLNEKISGYITERNFLFELVYSIIKSIVDNNIKGKNGFPLYRTKEFFAFISELHNDFVTIIRKNMITENGDIAKDFLTIENDDGVITNIRKRGGYSLRNEIARIEFKANILYK